MAKIFGVMSTFQPNEAVIERAYKHASQVDSLIVVDDGSADSSVLNQLQGVQFQIIRLKRNSGIAAALNVGLSMAVEQGAEYIITLDQDSILDANYVSSVLEAFEFSAKTTKLGVAITNSVNHESARPPRHSPEGFGLVDEGIQSGMVISTTCLIDSGLLDETLFIDCVDTEFCLRVRDHGWNIAVVPGTNIIHSLGELVSFTPFWRRHKKNHAQGTLQYHAPFREYYIARNNVNLCIRNFSKRPRWVLSVAHRELVPHLKVLTGSPNLRKQWLAVFVGTWHGLVRRRGKIPNWLSQALKV